MPPAEKALGGIVKTLQKASDAARRILELAERAANAINKATKPHRQLLEQNEKRIKAMQRMFDDLGRILQGPQDRMESINRMLDSIKQTDHFILDHEILDFYGTQGEVATKEDIEEIKLGIAEVKAMLRKLLEKDQYTEEEKKRLQEIAEDIERKTQSYV